MKILKTKLKAILTSAALFFTFTVFPFPTPIQANSGNDTNDTVFIEYFYPDKPVETVEVSRESVYGNPNDPDPDTEDFEFAVTDLTPTVTQTNESIIITIMGDGFTDTQQADFVNEATSARDQLLSLHPYSAFVEQIKIYAIQVVSEETLVGVERGKPVKNYFGTYIKTDGNTQYVSNYTQANNLVKSFFKSYELNADNRKLSIVLVNSTGIGVGSYGGFAVAPIRNRIVGDVAAHELGHSFANLRDERPGTRLFEEANKTQESDPDKIKWKPWIGVEGVGIFEVDPGWYCPHDDCKMKGSIYGPFCEVCASQLVRLFTDNTKEVFHGYLKDNLSDVTNVSLESATRIVDYAFFGRDDLTGITITDSVTSIGRYSFLRCNGLTNLIVPQTVTKIDDTAFFECKNLKIYGRLGSQAAVYSIGNDIPFALYNVADIRSLEELVMGIPVLHDTMGADLTRDGVVDAFDIVLAKRDFLNK